MITALLGELKAGKAPLADIRRAFLRATWPPDLAESIAGSHRELCQRAGKTDAHAYAQ